MKQRKSPDELNDKPFLDDKNFHLAGIIPVAGHKLDFGMEWDESLAPICPNYTLLRMLSTNALGLAVIQFGLW